MQNQPTINNRFVGVFDIIGFKALRDADGTESLHRKFSRGIMPGIEHSAAGRYKIIDHNEESVIVPDFSGDSVRYVVFSDTVFLFTKDDEFESFCNIVNAAATLLGFGFGIRAPYRGAIGWGDMIDDPAAGIYIGSAIEDAHDFESAQVWAGVMLTTKCEEMACGREYIRRYRDLNLEIANGDYAEQVRRNARKYARRLVQYSVPLQRNPKDGPAIYTEKTAHVIDWTLTVYAGAAEHSLPQTESRHSTAIRDNTMKFENWARSNNGNQ